MLDVKSVTAGGYDSAASLVMNWQPVVYQVFHQKFYWFASHGYFPHAFQMVFHGAHRDELLTPNRHLVAGRRGGKTLSAAWEVLFYALHPREFHRDMHGVESDRGLWIWVLTKDYPTGFASKQTLLEVMRQAGLKKGADYVENKTERRIEFPATGTLIQFKTAEDPQSLRGAGLDLLWMDEAAFITDSEAYDVVSPALADKDGGVITTTTPHGKNWLWEEFFDGEALKDPREFRVQYTSIDNPYFKRSVWERYRRRYHPILFKQEFLASFEALHGVALQGEWLHYWTAGRADPQSNLVSIQDLKGEDGRYNLDIYLGVDPAISLSDRADQFAMAVIGITKDRTMGFVLDIYLGRIEFPDQLDLIQTWMLKWRPTYIGIEANAYQKALVQQASRLDGFPNIIPIMSKGKKNERILTMSPVFKTGKIRIHHSQNKFIDQWVGFDPEKKNQHDDLLDAVEIALGVAGILLPLAPHEMIVEDLDRPVDHSDLAALVKAQIRDQLDEQGPFDPEMGTEW
jgi:predicted phage terminase large subunit-like protein